MQIRCTTCAEEAEGALEGAEALCFVACLCIVIMRLAVEVGVRVTAKRRLSAVAICS